MSARFLFYFCGDQNKASSRVRGYWVADELNKKGIRTTLEFKDSKMNFLLFFFRVPFNDVIFFQKVYTRWHCWLLRWAIICRKKTVFDLDDAPSRINHPVTLQNVQFMLKNVSLVTVGSKKLVEYASNFSDNVELVPSSINSDFYKPNLSIKSKNKKKITFGWIGNGSHYKNDLIEILHAPLMHLAQKHDVRLKLIGACGEKELYDVFGSIENLEIDLVDDVQWSNPQEVSLELQDIDVGLYPLLSNDFNKYKCGFKALEYMAMGIPVVSSTVSENMDIICSGVDGFLVDNKEWHEVLFYFIENKHKIRTMGDNGIRKVQETYNIKVASRKILSGLSFNKDRR